MPARSKKQEKQTLPPQEQILHPNGGEVVNG